jgi:hypothetical protein
MLSAASCFAKYAVYVLSSLGCLPSLSTLTAVPGLTQGYGITLGTINALSVIISVLQAIPSLGLQVCPAPSFPAAPWLLPIAYRQQFCCPSVMQRNTCLKNLLSLSICDGQSSHSCWFPTPQH